MSRYEWREGYGLWDTKRGTYLLLGDDEHARILWRALNAEPQASAEVAEALRSARLMHNDSQGELACLPPDKWAVITAELDRLRRHLASAQAWREDEYRQREAWRARHGRLEEVLKSIAEKRQPEAYTDWRAWHKWAEEVQDLAREWAPEEEG